MTIILPSGPIAKRRARIKWRIYFAKRRLRRKLSWRYRARETMPGATDLRRITYTLPNGKKSKMTVGKVKFEPFKFSGPVHPDGLTVPVNNDNSLSNWNWFDGSTE